MIVLPEKIGVVADQDLSTSDVIFQTVADRTGATIVAGLIHLTLPLRFNQARVYTPGASVSSYDKQHLLPAPFESKFTPGTALTLLSKAPAPWGVAICKDLDFTRPARQYAQAHTGLLLVPAWDFNLDRVWHGHIAQSTFWEALSRSTELVSMAAWGNSWLFGIEVARHPFRSRSC